MLSRQQFGDLAGELHTKGGFSVNIHTGERPTSGMMVSDLRGEKSMPLATTRGEDIQSFAEENKGKRLRGERRYLGGWADREQKPAMAYLDRSTRYPDTPHGQARGYVRMVANFQKSAYDVGKDAYIPNPAQPQDQPRDLQRSMRRMQGQNVP
jgi:hypothetical protein